MDVHAIDVRPIETFVAGPVDAVPPAPPPGPPIALVIDDDPVVRDLVEVAVEPLGLTCEHVADGHAALARLHGPPAELVLLDVRLPYHSGLEVLRRLRARPAWRDVPVLIVTACDTEDIRLLALDADADDVVAKPFAVPELRARAARRLRARALV